MQGIVRKILAVFALAAHFSNMAVFAEEEAWECPAKTGAHVGKICQCLEVRRPGGAGAKSITDFVCPETTMGDQDVAYRVVLDLEFKEIDKKAEAKLKEMQARTGKDFVDMDQDTANWFVTTSTDSEFYKQYSKTCADLSDPKNPLRQTVESFPE